MSNLHPIVEGDLKAVTSEPLPWERFARKTVLVTGAGGFLGSCLVETLLFLNATRGIGCKVVGLVRNGEKARRRFAHHPPDALAWVEGDVADQREWAWKFDFIIHAASQASPKYYGPDPVGTMRANLLGTSQLLNKAREDGGEGFLFISSGEVYGQVAADQIPTKETDYGYLEITDPRSCYAEGKRAAETLGVSYGRQFGVPFTVARPFHTYGPGMALDDGRVFADFVGDVVHGRNLMLRSDGTAVRAFCYLSDAVAGIFTVLLKGVQGMAYNVGNPEGALSMAELAALLAGIRADCPLSVVRTAEQRPGYLPSPIAKNIPNVDRLKALGWRPNLSPHDGFARTIRFFLEN